MLSIKLHSDETVDWYKALLVALWNRQEYRVCYEESFALVNADDYNSLAISIVTSRGWSLHLMNVKYTFLHGDFKEDIYMTSPLGLFSSPYSAVYVKAVSLWLKIDSKCGLKNSVLLCFAFRLFNVK